ncbi:hypothetical protein KCP73_07495 [Salmonella enterica subsp. enterica]|nr:hypothetical protein KCP73_07495 [Salmonella enterica subsp. enterica]
MGGYVSGGGLYARSWKYSGRLRQSKTVSWADQSSGWPKSRTVMQAFPGAFPNAEVIR